MPPSRRTRDRGYGRFHPESTRRTDQLIDIHVPSGHVTEGGGRNNISVALQYLESWLRGTGAVAIFNLMEDAATAEISRAQLWQWLHQQISFTKTPSVSGADAASESDVVTAALFGRLQAEELAKLGPAEGQMYAEAAEILNSLILSEEFIEFLTLPAYNHLK